MKRPILFKEVVSVALAIACLAICSPMLVADCHDAENAIPGLPCSTWTWETTQKEIIDLSRFKISVFTEHGSPDLIEELVAWGVTEIEVDQYDQDLGYCPTRIVRLEGTPYGSYETSLLFGGTYKILLDPHRASTGRIWPCEDPCEKARSCFEVNYMIVGPTDTLFGEAQMTLDANACSTWVPPGVPSEYEYEDPRRVPANGYYVWKKHKVDPELAIALSSFDAADNENYVELKWATGTEIGNAGFHIHRSQEKDAEYVKINGDLIPANGSEGTGADYSYIDMDVMTGRTYYYKLESVNLTGHSTWHGPISVTLGTTGIAEGPGALIPDAFALTQNYPNPFNVETDIRYQIPEAGNITLKIYNVLGQEISTLVDGIKEAGYHTVHWDGTDSFGQQVPSGVYIYRMTAGTWSATKRMALLK